jgi:uncharacterized protein YndB with AHSA1/START domain
VVPSNATELALHLEHVLPTGRERVWRAHVDPHQLAEWWGPKGFTCPSIELDVRVGGRYRIAMQPPEGDLFHLEGEFREVDPPRRLAYTFIWDPPAPDDRETIARVTLEEEGGSTRFILDQGPFATEERRALHEGGWSDGFERLEQLLR